jgi:dipeptidase E
MGILRCSIPPENRFWMTSSCRWRGDCPHYDGEPGRRPGFEEIIAQGAPSGYASDDGVALHFEGTRFKEAESSRPNAKAYRVSRKRAEVVEAQLDVRYLGPKK